MAVCSHACRHRTVGTNPVMFGDGENIAALLISSSLQRFHLATDTVCSTVASTHFGTRGQSGCWTVNTFYCTAACGGSTTRI